MSRFQIITLTITAVSLVIGGFNQLAGAVDMLGTMWRWGIQHWPVILVLVGVCSGLLTVFEPLYQRRLQAHKATEAALRELDDRLLRSIARTLRAMDELERRLTAVEIRLNDCQAHADPSHPSAESGP